MPTLEDALELAANAHRGQKDKAGEPYILHPLRIMLRMESEEERLVALLHDVVEDTEISIDELRRRGYSVAVLDAVEALTKRDGEAYAAAIERAAVNPLARRVKLADLEDNMDLRRRIPLTEEDFARLERYHRAHARLRTVS